MDYCYRVYMTDGIKACAGNTAGAFGGSELTQRWNDLYKPQDVRDAETIKSTISEKLNRMGSDNGSI